MNKNILVINGSPRVKRSNSDVICNDLMNNFTNKDIECTKMYLEKIINEKDTILNNMNKSDVIVLIVPIYENSVPSTVIEFFEMIYENKGELDDKNRKMFIITNSGFPEMEENKSTITTCRLFAKEMKFEWLGGIAIAPGTLINGKELGKTYKKLKCALAILADDIYKGSVISQKVFQLTSKPFISPILYRFVGKIVQKKPIKKIGKANFYAKPFVD